MLLEKAPSNAGQNIKSLEGQGCIITRKEAFLLKKKEKALNGR